MMAGSELCGSRFSPHCQMWFFSPAPGVLFYFSCTLRKLEQWMEKSLCSEGQTGFAMSTVRGLKLLLLAKTRPFLSEICYHAYTVKFISAKSQTYIQVQLDLRSCYWHHFQVGTSGHNTRLQVN